MSLKPDLVNMEMAVTFLIYLVLYLVAGIMVLRHLRGVGVVYLPVDMIRAWKNRPRPLDLEALAKEKKAVVELQGTYLRWPRWPKRTFSSPRGPSQTIAHPRQEKLQYFESWDTQLGSQG